MVVSALFALVSCAPQAFVVSPEMRGPSKSGLNLAGKSLAVVYLTDGNPRGEAFNASAAGGFATRLEEDYFGGNREVELFTARGGEGVDYASKDSLVSLVLETGKDVVFVIDTPELGIPSVKDPVRVTGMNVSTDSSFVSVASVPFTTKIFVYDSMNKEDRVFGFAGGRNFKVEVYSDGKRSKDEKFGAISLPELRTPAMSRPRRSFPHGNRMISTSFIMMALRALGTRVRNMHIPTNGRRRSVSGSHF